jgi:isoleucyl-tRNA synthetase
VGNLFDFDPVRDALPPEKLQPMERWVMSRADELLAIVTAAYDRYEFHVAMRELTQFCNVTLSAQYIDVCKDVLYCEAANSPKRRSAQSACWALASLLTRMVAPILVHTADEMWEHLPKPKSEPPSVHLASWPSVGDGKRHVDFDLDRRFATAFKAKAEVDRVLDRMRKEGKVGKGYDTVVSLGAKPELMAELAAMGTQLAEYFNVSGVALTDAAHHAAAEGYEPATDVPGLFVKVTQSAESPCVRCYRRTGDVGKHKHARHPELCNRCAEVVGDSA